MFHDLITAQDDYIPVSNMELTFQPAPTPQPQCDDIQLENDNIVESDEIFRVILSSTDSAVVTDPNTATVTISNDDSKLP